VGPGGDLHGGHLPASADSSPPAPAQVSDKLLHLLAYAGLAVIVCRAVVGGLPSRLSWRAALITLAVTIGYAMTDELHQMFVPGRSPDVYDVAADAAGAAIGLIACGAWGIIRAPHPRSQLPNPNAQR
jgi:VanZ family protein